MAAAHVPVEHIAAKFGHFGKVGGIEDNAFGGEIGRAKDAVLIDVWVFFKAFAL